MSLLVLAALLIPTALMAQGSKTNFTGSWTYNAAKSVSSQPQGQPQGQGQRPGGPARKASIPPAWAKANLSPHGHPTEKSLRSKPPGP